MNLVQKYFLIILCLLCSTVVFAQFEDHKVEELGGYVFSWMVIDGDTIAVADLPPVSVSSPKYQQTLDQYRFNKLKRNTMIVYPYAIKAVDLMNEIDATTEEIKKKRHKKKYLNKLEKELKDEFKRDLKDLTVSQGKVLVKLIERESGMTFKTILRKYKSGTTTFFYEKIGGKFGYDFEGYEASENPDLELILSAIEN